MAQALRGILAQRLIRKLCPKCKVIEPVDPITRARLEMLQLPVDQASLYQPKGCAHCHDTGYKGRVAVHEMLILDDEMMLAIRDSDARKFAELAHASPLYKSLMHAAYEVALSGDTSLDEVMKLQDDLKSSETELSVDSEAENALV